MSHRNKGNGKMPGKHATPRTWRRFRIRHSTKETIVTSPNPPHYHIDNGQHFNSLGGKPANAGGGA